MFEDFRIWHTSAYVSIRQHTSAYVRIRQHTSAACVSIRPARQQVGRVSQDELLAVSQVLTLLALLVLKYNY